VLFSAFRDPQRHHQHLATKVNAIDHLVIKEMTGGQHEVDERKGLSKLG
jgi:hypothetical protein